MATIRSTTVEINGVTVTLERRAMNAAIVASWMTDDGHLCQHTFIDFDPVGACEELQDVLIPLPTATVSVTYEEHWLEDEEPEPFTEAGYVAFINHPSLTTVGFDVRRPDDLCGEAFAEWRAEYAPPAEMPFDDAARLVADWPGGLWIDGWFIDDGCDAEQDVRTGRWRRETLHVATSGQPARFDRMVDAAKASPFPPDYSDVEV